MLTSGVVLFHLHTAVHTRAVLMHFYWQLFYHPLYSPYSYLKNWLRSHHFNSNEELMEDVKTWLSSQADISDRNFDMISASFPVVIMYVK
jgi:hypothetical protein